MTCVVAGPAVLHGNTGLVKSNTAPASGDSEAPFTFGRLSDEPRWRERDENAVGAPDGRQHRRKS
jgi:hypothetical protein